MKAPDDFPHFKCPKCGSSHFGTAWPHAAKDRALVSGPLTTPEMQAASSALFAKNAIGTCHGYVGDEACRFTWKRSDDALYFHPEPTMQASVLGAVVANHARRRDS